MNIEQLLSEIVKLNRQERLELLNKLKELTYQKEQSTQGKQPPMLSELSGTGAEIWRNENIDAYIENERQWD